MGKILIGLLFTFCAMLPSSLCADTRIVFLNKCQDADFECLNETQAAKSTETVYQIKKAIEKVRFKKNIKIFSVDPKRPSANVWEYGAWAKKGKIYFSAMPGCPNARLELEKLLVKIK